MKEKQFAATRALSCMDLTSLNAEDSEDRIRRLCEKANTGAAHPAAICVYPQFVAVAKQRLAELAIAEVKVATVVNFPHGQDDVEQVVAQTQAAIAAGVDEIDLVFPYQALLAGDAQSGAVLVEQVKATCGTGLLKVILETGVLAQPDIIKQATEIAIAAGADFIKTSTGKVETNATIEAAQAILETIEAFTTCELEKIVASCDHQAQQAPRKIGFKVSGGVTNLQEAQAYMQLAATIMGKEWVQPAHFRIGASRLLDDLLNVIQDDAEDVPS